MTARWSDPHRLPGPLSSATPGTPAPSARRGCHEGWRDGLRGAMALLKFTLGTSLVSGLLAIVTLIVLLVHSGGRPT